MKSPNNFILLSLYIFLYFHFDKNNDKFSISHNDIEINTKWVDTLKLVFLLVKDLDSLFDDKIVTILHKYIEHEYKNKKLNKNSSQVLLILTYIKADHKQRKKIKDMQPLDRSTMECIDNILTI